MAVWPGMMVSFTPEQTALLDKGWTLCRLAVVLPIVLCPPIYLHHRETLTGKGHAWSIAIGIIYALVMLLVLAAIIKVIQH